MLSLICLLVSTFIECDVFYIKVGVILTKITLTKCIHLIRKLN